MKLRGNRSSPYLALGSPAYAKMFANGVAV
jgi:hypothetical protein